MAVAAKTSALNHFWRIVATGLSFLVFGLGGVLIGLLAYPVLLLLTHKDNRYRFGQALVHYVFKAFVWFMKSLGIFTLEIHHQERLKPANQFFIANHPTLIDVVILLSLIKESDCVVNARLARNVVTKGPLLATGYIENNEAEELIDTCVKRLQSGRNLLIFPEGTRTKKLDRLKFKRGVSLIALKSGHNITPIYINCQPRMLAKGQKWYKIPRSKPHFTIRVGEQLPTQDLLKNVKVLSIQSRQLNKELLNHYYEELKIG